MKTTTDGGGVPPGVSPTTESDKLRRHRRRRRLFCCLICLLVVLALLILIVVLFFVLLRPRDPTTTLISTRVRGVSPRVSLFPQPQIKLNITLELLLRVHNPNRASFAHSDDGAAQLYYRSEKVGDADIPPGKLPARGDADMELELTVEAERLVSQVGNLIGDVLAGSVALDVDARIPGRVTILGLIKRHAVAESKCHVVVGFPDLKVRSQYCSNKTKL